MKDSHKAIADKMVHAIMSAISEMKRREHEEHKEWLRESLKRDEGLRAEIDAKWKPGPDKKKLLATMDRSIKRYHKWLARPFKPWV